MPDAIKKPGAAISEVLAPKVQNRYSAIIAKVFANHYGKQGESFEFTRDEFAGIAAELGVNLPKNVGDLIYSFRYRNEFPQSILATAKNGLEWIIEGAGRAKYRFRLVKLNRIAPREELLTIKVPDATPRSLAPMRWAMSRRCWQRSATTGWSTSFLASQPILCRTICARQ